MLEAFLVLAFFAQDDLVAGEPKKLAGGMEWTEGPIVDAKGDVYFAGDGKIKKWDGKELTTWTEAFTNIGAVRIDGQGNLVVTGGKGVTRISPDGKKVETLAETYNGQPFNQPNDLCIDAKGGIYFTDPNYGAPESQDRHAVYYISPDGKKVTRVINDLVQPNGIEYSKDRLFVADPQDGKLYVYGMNADGTLKDRKLFAEGLACDGLKLDEKGNVYTTVQWGVLIFDGKGKKIGAVKIPEGHTANCCFGEKTLYVTATTSLYAIPMKVSGYARSASERRPGGDVEKLAEGLKFTEGPVADKKGHIYFSDIPANRIMKWDGKGLTIWRKDSGGANGLKFDKEGNLVACEGGNKRVARISPDQKVTVLADIYDGKKFNAPNDLCFDAKGGLYFTDPNYGDPAETTQGVEGVYYVAPDGSNVIRVVDDLERPNGIELWRDRLYIADHGGGKVHVYGMNANGTLKDKKVFCEVSCDGLKADRAGNIYTTTRKGVEVFDAEGKPLRVIPLPDIPTNCCFDPAFEYLYVTDRKTFLRVRVKED